MVIADNLKDQTFWMTYPYFEVYNSLSLIGLLFGYSLQIFSDFAGYSLIAIGIAKLFGYDLPKNFNFPYISKSFSEFWNRWHISLSTWLKEYLYIPLGGNRKGKIRTYFNLMIVMALGGFWHGAAISYMVWGMYHGFFLAIERYFSQYVKLPKNVFIDFMTIFLVFSIVTLGWLLFKLTQFNEVLIYLYQIFLEPRGITAKYPLMMIFFYSIPIIIYYINYLIYKKSSINYLDSPYIYSILLFFIFTSSGSSGAFIYFQF